MCCGIGGLGRLKITSLWGAGVERAVCCGRGGLGGLKPLVCGGRGHVLWKRGFRGVKVFYLVRAGGGGGGGGRRGPCVV